MLQIVLLAGKFIFLIILYLFVFRVVRSTTRELRVAAPVEGAQDWQAPGAVYVVGEGPADAMVVAPALTGVWTLLVDKSPCLSAGAAYAFPVGVRALAGRDADMDIYLDDTFVSSKHALFETTAAGLQVEDLRSTNGTQVNGSDITDMRVLQAGDRVEVGDTVFRVEVQ
jgi:hypothetical protein